MEYFEWGRSGFLYCDLIDKWARVFGNASIKTILYHKSLVKDSIESFQKVIGLDLLLKPIAGKKVNGTILVEFVNLIKMINEVNLPFDVRWKLVQEIELLSDTLIGQSSDIQVPEDWFELLRANFRENNIQFSRRFMGGNYLSYLSFDSDDPCL